jgi:hypothetical protein
MLGGTDKAARDARPKPPAPDDDWDRRWHKEARVPKLDSLLMRAHLLRVEAERPELDHAIVRGLYERFMDCRDRQPDLHEFRDYVDEIASSVDWLDLWHEFSPHEPTVEELEAMCAPVEPQPRCSRGRARDPAGRRTRHSLPGGQILRGMLEPLFSGISIGKAFEDQRRKALADVDLLPLDAVSEQDLDEIVAASVERWRFEPLDFHWDAKTVASTDIDRVIAGQPQTSKGARTALTLIVPFSGKMSGLLRMRPSTRPQKPPGGFIWGNQLLLSYSGVSADPATVQRAFERQETAVRECLSAIGRDVAAFNAELPGLLRAALQVRLDKIHSDNDLVEALGAPRATVELPRAALDVPGPQEDREWVPPRPSPVRRTRPRRTRLVTRARLFSTLRQLDVDADAGKLKTRDGRMRPYATMQDLAERLDVALTTLKDFLKAEELDWDDRSSWPVE